VARRSRRKRSVAKTVAKRKVKSIDEVIARTLREAGFSPKVIGEQIKKLDDPDAVRAILIAAGQDKRLNPEPSAPVKPEGREGKGQGKVKRKGGMLRATAKGDNTRIGQVAIKRAWSAARAAVGEERWKVMTKEQKTAETLKRVGKMTGEEAIGAARALGSRVLPLAGSNDEVEKIIDGWAKGQGVKAPKTEMAIGAKGKAEGKGGKEVARAAGKGAEAPAGPEKPKAGEGKKAKRIIRRRSRLDEILRTGEDEDSRTRRLAQKPTPDADAVVGETQAERKARLKAARAEDLDFKNKNMVPFEEQDGTVRWIPKAEGLPAGTRKIRIKAKGGVKVVANVKDGKVYLLNESGKLRTMELKDYRAALARGEDPNPPSKVKKGTGVKQEFGEKMRAVTAAGKTLNAEYITESAAQAFMDANRKISEKNKIALGKGTSPDDLAPRYKVADFVDAAYPNLGKAERSQLISGIRKSFRGERKVRKAARAAAKAGKVTELRPETVEEGRKKLNAKDERIAKGKAAPLEKVKLESKAEGKRRARRVKTVGQTLSAVMDPSKSTPSAEAMEPAPKKAKRVFTPKAPGSELEMEISKLRDNLNPEEKRTFKKIKEVARLGFTKAQVKERAAAGAFGKITPKVKKIAKAGGYLGLVATALQFLEAPKTGKK
jgi:hypothetical protein